MKARQALGNALLKGLFRVRDAVQPVCLAERHDARALAVGHDAKPDIGRFHLLQPRAHRLRRHVGRVGNDRVVKSGTKCPGRLKAPASAPSDVSESHRESGKKTCATCQLSNSAQERALCL